MHNSVAQVQPLLRSAELITKHSLVAWYLGISNDKQNRLKRSTELQHGRRRTGESSTGEVQRQDARLMPRQED